MRVRERLICATAALMRRHGVAGTGIAQILDASGVTRRSIYLNFPGGKAELVTAATCSAGDEMAATLGECFAQPDPIEAFTRMWSTALIEMDFEGGCPVVAAACSRGDTADAADAAAGAFATWTDLIADRLVDDGIDRREAQSLATTIVAAFEGAVLLCRAARSTAPLEQVSAHLRRLVALAGTS